MKGIAANEFSPFEFWDILLEEFDTGFFDPVIAHLSKFEFWGEKSFTEIAKELFDNELKEKTESFRTRIDELVIENVKLKEMISKHESVKWMSYYEVI